MITTVDVAPCHAVLVCPYVFLSPRLLQVKPQLQQNLLSFKNPNAGPSQTINYW